MSDYTRCEQGRREVDEHGDVTAPDRQRHFKSRSKFATANNTPSWQQELADLSVRQVKLLLAAVIYPGIQESVGDPILARQMTAFCVGLFSMAISLTVAVVSKGIAKYRSRDWSASEKDCGDHNAEKRY